jgi:two-component system OmpR family sensor kinase
MAERIDTEIGRIDHLVGELLTLSRLEAGEGISSRRPLDIGEMVTDIVADVRFEAQSKNSVIDWTEHEPIVVSGIAPLLHSAIENIVRNAQKHAPGSEILLEADLDKERGLYYLRVMDRGPGLVPEELARIFEPFFRTGNTHAAGHGLGLTIARRSIEAHGGTITASNREGGGLCMEVALPYQEGEKQEG